MITSVMGGRWQPNRAYKALCEKLTKLQSKSDTWYELKYNDKTYDIRKSLIYLSSRTVLPGFEFEFGAALPTEMALKIVDRCSKQETKSMDMDTGKVVSKKPADNKGTADIGLIASIVGTGTAALFVDDSAELIYSSKKLSNELFAVGMILAFSVIDGKTIKIPNIYNAHALLIYYWMYRNDVIDGQLLNILFKCQAIEKMRTPKIEDNESLEEYMGRFSSDKVTKIYINYFNEFSMYGSSIALIKSMQDLIVEIREFKREDKQTQVFLEKIDKFLDSDSVKYAIKKAIGRRRRVNHTEVILGTTFIIPGMNVVFDEYIALAYEYLYFGVKEAEANKDSIEGKKVKINDKYEDIKYIIRSLGMVINNSVACSSMQVGMVSLYGVIEKANEMNRSAEIAIEQRDKIQTKYNELRNKQKELSKEIKELNREIIAEKNKADRLQKHLDDGNINISEFNRIREENKRLTIELSNRSSELSEASRQLSRKDKEIDYLNSKVDELKGSTNELTEQLQESKELATKMALHRTFSEIPMECFINAIKSKRIVLVGGDMMHTKIRDYGLNDIRMFKAGCREITYEDLSDADLLVVITAHVDHASIEGPVKIAKTHDIPVLKFGNKNTEMLIYTMFEEFYK